METDDQEQKIASKIILFGKAGEPNFAGLPGGFQRLHKQARRITLLFKIKHGVLLTLRVLVFFLFISAMTFITAELFANDLPAAWSLFVKDAVKESAILDNIEVINDIVCFVIIFLYLFGFIVE